MPIFTHSYISTAVIEARAIDMRNDTDLALQRVAELTHLTPEAVAEIARDVAHAESKHAAIAAMTKPAAEVQP